MRARGRMPWAGAIGALAVLLAGCGQNPTTPILGRPETPADAPLPAACLGPGLDLALGLGVYTVPLSGETASADDLPLWESAALQMPPIAQISTGDGPFTLCAYVADHPTPFATRGGDDTIVCVLVDADGDAALLGERTVVSGGEASACAPGDGG